QLVPAQQLNREMADKLWTELVRGVQAAGLMPAREPSHGQLMELYEKAGATLDEAVRVRVGNLDMGFHAALAFASGLPFWEEAVIHFWTRFYPRAKERLNVGRIQEVIDQHKDLLDVIRPKEREAGDPDAVTRVYLDHVYSAVKQTWPRGRKSAPVSARPESGG